MNSCAIILENAGATDIVVHDDGTVDATLEGKRFLGFSIIGIENGEYEDE